MDEIEQLKHRIAELERENIILRKKPFHAVEGATVAVPEQFKEIFDNAQKIVQEYFKGIKTDPTKGTIEISGQRYILVRASALSYDFFHVFQSLYADRGHDQAIQIGRNFLFDIAHVIGMQDAKSFIEKMQVDDPIAKLSTGPIHFAYSGWAFVDINAESRPSPDENYYLKYTHPYSFEADSWLQSGKKSEFPVCIMNSGYSSGWCEESFGIELTAVEISCRARGDKHCEFVMAPPSRIDEYLAKEKQYAKSLKKHAYYDIPTFFQRKKVEEEMRNAQKKAEDSDRAKTEFLANVSHEIRTPLNAILGYVDLILKDKPSQTHHQYLTTVQESGQILQTIVNDVLDLSKIESGQLVVENVPVCLKAMLESIESTAKALILQQSKPIQLIKNYQIKLEGVYFLTDVTRLSQVLLNLISNAVKFTHAGSIELGLTVQDGGMLRFWVKDTGVGIAKAKQALIFDLFSQVDSSIIRQQGGPGLGLTITEKLVRLLGGKIWLESNENKGSTFYFSTGFNVIETSNSVKNRRDEVVIKKINPIHVLLVDDNRVNLALAKRVLEKAGHKVTAVGDGQQALDLYKTTSIFDLVLMDMQMPVLDGLTAVQLMREWERKKKQSPIIIIALTANALEEEKVKCLQVGCNEYLTKPIDSDKLISVIHSHFVS